MTSGLILEQDEDFFLEELEVEKHLLDYHRIWSDPASLIWSYVENPTYTYSQAEAISRTQAPKQNLEETRSWLLRWTKEADPRMQNYGIMLRPSSMLNPTNPRSAYFPPPAIDQGAEAIAPSETRTRTALPSGGRPYLIGQVGILRPAPDHPSESESHNTAPEMGYMIHRTHWGLGLATRAVRLFLAYYWTELNPEHEEENEGDVVEAHIDPANAGSERIAVKLGFEPGEWAGEEFRLAHSKELRRLRVWRVHRPLTSD